MAPLAIFGITNDGLNLAVNLLLLFLAVLWLALVYWTYADAKRRIADPMLVGCATIAALFPFVGTIVYMVVRPPEYLEDVHERELEIAAAEARLASANEHACPYCEYPVERSFLRCPSCLRRLKEPCGTCSKPLDPRWRICPYCEAEVPDRGGQPRRRGGGGGSAPSRGRPRQPDDAEPRQQRKRPAEDAEARQQRKRPSDGEGRPTRERPSGDEPTRVGARSDGAPPRRRPRPADDEAAPRPRTQKRPAQADQRPATSAGGREPADPRRERD